jgi:transcriptional regulator with XRE-family HTH domain
MPLGPPPAAASTSRPPEREDVGVTDASPETQLAALGALLRAQRVSAELSLRELANRTNVSNAYLSELERGLHEPSLRVLRAIASALGTPLGSMLASAGVLGDREDDHHPSGVGETEAAILRDAELSEPQRTALLSVYRSFVQTHTSR